MKNRIPQNYFIGSLLVHCIIFLVLAISLHGNKQNSFIVFGAHSKKTTKVLFKSPPKNGRFSKNKKSLKSGPKSTKKPAKKSVEKPVKKPEKKPAKKPEKKLEKKAQKKEKTPEETVEKIKEKQDGDEINIGKLSKKQKKLKDKEKKEQEKKKQAELKREREVKDKEKEEQEKKEQEERDQEERDKERQEEQEREEEQLKKEQEKSRAAQEEDPLEDLDEEFDDQDEKNNEPEEFNFLTLSDKEQAVYHKKIQQEVNRLWRPPLGVARGTKCVVSFVVGEDGTIESFEITKRSNMLIYDLSIQRVAMNFKFDKSLWGKKFRIDFQQ